MAMSLSQRHPDNPYEQTGVKLGTNSSRPSRTGSRAGWRWSGSGWNLAGQRLRALRIGLPVRRDRRTGVRDGANLTVEGCEFAPSFSIWTTIEECLNPPVIWGEGPGLVHHAAVQRARGVRLPEGIGPVECVNVEHEEVLLMPRWIECKRATFKYGLGDEFIEVLKVLHKLGLDRTEKVKVGGAEVSPRDVVAACLPNPATLGPQMKGKTCAGLWVTGGTRTANRALDLSVPRGGQRVVDEGVRPPVRGVADRDQSGCGTGASGERNLERCRRARAGCFDSVPFLELLTAYGSPWGRWS